LTLLNELILWNILGKYDSGLPQIHQKKLQRDLSRSMENWI